jgi:hypothetical protein
MNTAISATAMTSNNSKSMKPYPVPSKPQHNPVGRDPASGALPPPFRYNE